MTEKKGDLRKDVAPGAQDLAALVAWARATEGHGGVAAWETGVLLEQYEEVEAAHAALLAMQRHGVVVAPCNDGRGYVRLRVVAPVYSPESMAAFVVWRTHFDHMDRLADAFLRRGPRPQPKEVA